MSEDDDIDHMDPMITLGQSNTTDQVQIIKYE